MHFALIALAVLAVIGDLIAVYQLSQRIRRAIQTGYVRFWLRRWALDSHDTSFRATWNEVEEKTILKKLSSTSTQTRMNGLNYVYQMQNLSEKILKKVFDLICEAKDDDDLTKLAVRVLNYKLNNNRTPSGS